MAGEVVIIKEMLGEALVDSSRMAFSKMPLEDSIPATTPQAASHVTPQEALASKTKIPILNSAPTSTRQTRKIMDLTRQVDSELLEGLIIT